MQAQAQLLACQPIDLPLLVFIGILLGVIVATWLIGWRMREIVEDASADVRRQVLVRLVAERPRGLTAEDFDLVFNRHRRHERVAWLSQRINDEQGNGRTAAGSEDDGPEAA